MKTQFNKTLILNTIFFLSFSSLSWAQSSLSEFKNIFKSSDIIFKIKENKNEIIYRSDDFVIDNRKWTIIAKFNAKSKETISIIEYLYTSLNDVMNIMGEKVNWVTAEVNEITNVSDENGKIFNGRVCFWRSDKNGNPLKLQFAVINDDSRTLLKEIIVDGLYGISPF